MAQEIYLNQEGFTALVNYINNQLNNKANKDDQIVLPNDLVHTADLANFLVAADLAAYAKKTELPDLSSYVTNNELADYALNTDLQNYATNQQLDTLEAKVTGVYHFKGTVANLTALQAIQNPQVGDVYNVADTGVNAAWTGEVWDEFGTQVDLSDYALKTDAQAIAMAEVQRILFSGNAAVVSDKASFTAMIANDEPEVEITLNKNITVTEPLNIPEGKTVTVDLGGKTLSSGSNYALTVDGGDLILKNGKVESTGTGDLARAVVVFDGSVTVDGAEVVSQHDCAISAVGEGSEVIIESGRVQAQESGVLVTQGASVVVNGGEIECTDNCPLQGNGTAGKGNVNMVMNGGKLIAHITSNSYIACGVYMPNSGSFTMNGGEIESDGCGICMRGGTVNIGANAKITATGASGVAGKVGDSRIVVGPYAVVYDAHSKYPAVETLELNIADGAQLIGTDGDVDVLLADDIEANIHDNRS